MKLFTQEQVKQYRPYFDNIKVISEANKIVDAVNNCNDMSKEEVCASAILAYTKLYGED